MRTHATTALAATALAAACHVPDRHYVMPGGGDAGPSDANPDGGTNPIAPPIRAFDGPVNTVLHVGHAWYVGGGFDRASPYGTPNFAQLDPAGTPSSCLGGFDDQVWSLARVGSSLYVGGLFTTYRGAPANRIAKIDATSCALDNTFSPPAPAVNGFDGAVFALVATSTALYVGGHFTTYRGVASSANYLAKLDLITGAQDTTFSPAGATSNGFDADVDAMTISGNALYVGGAFTAYRGVTQSANRLAKLDVTSGDIDTTFGPPGATANGFGGAGTFVKALAVSNGALYVGGYFTTYRGSLSANDVAKLDAVNGSLDTAFSPPTSNGFDNAVTSIAISGNSLYVGGSFSAYRGTAHSANSLAKLDLATGALDTTFSPPGTTANGFDYDVRALAVSGSSLYVGGHFTSYRGAASSANRIAKLDLTTGALDTAFVPAGSTTNGFDADVLALAFDGSNVWVGGQFSVYAGHVANYIAKLDDTTLAMDATFSPSGSANGFDNAVYALAASGTALYVGGWFQRYRAVPSSASRLAKLDLDTGVLDTTFSPPGANGFSLDTLDRVFALAISGGSLYVGGTFTGYRGVAYSAYHLAKLDLATGELDTTFSPPGATANGFDGVGVNALAISGTSLYVGGGFTTYKGVVSANNLAKLDATNGSFDTSFSPPSSNGFDRAVSSLVVSGSSLYVGGYFTAYRGAASSASYLAKLDLTTGALDTAFSPTGATANGFDSWSNTLAVAGSSLYVGGDFTAYRGTAGSASHLAKLDLTTGAQDTTFSPPLANGLDAAALALGVFNGSVYVGGNFDRYRGSTVAVHAAILDATTGDLK